MNSTTASCPVTAIVLLQSLEECRELAGTLASLGELGEVILADGVGLTELPETRGVPYQHLPLAGMSGVVLKKRSALTASQPWILFIRPGERVDARWFERVQKITDKPPSFTPCYVFPVLINWQGVSWVQPPGESGTILVERSWFLEHPIERAKPVFVETPLLHTLPANGLSRWLDERAEYQAQKRLQEQGGAMIRRDLFLGWLKETAGRGLMDGVLRGQWFFDRAKRIPLFISLVQAHLTWLKLYAYTYDGTGDVAGLLPAPSKGSPG